MALTMSASKGNNYKKNKSHIRRYQCWEMGHYASERQNPKSDDTTSKRRDEKCSARVAVVRDNAKKETEKTGIFRTRNDLSFVFNSVLLKSKLLWTPAPRPTSSLKRSSISLIHRIVS